jgi:hypothetical protein
LNVSQITLTEAKQITAQDQQIKTLKEQIESHKAKEYKPAWVEPIDPERKLKPAEMIILENGRQLALRKAAYEEEQRLKMAETNGESK